MFFKNNLGASSLPLCFRSYLLLAPLVLRLQRPPCVQRAETSVTVTTTVVTGFVWMEVEA